MLKKWFDWTPRDIAAWEKIRAKGLGRFLLGYSSLVGGGLFVIVGSISFFRWRQAAADLASLGLELLLMVFGCLLGGLLNSLLTWWLEERIYRKIVAGRTKG